MIMTLPLPPRSWKATSVYPWGLFWGIVWWLVHGRWWTNCWPGKQSVWTPWPSTVFWPEWGMDRESSQAATSAWCWSTPRRSCCSCPYAGAPSWSSSPSIAIHAGGLADGSGCWSSFRLLPSGLPSSQWFIWMEKEILFALQGEKVVLG